MKTITTLTLSALVIGLMSSGLLLTTDAANNSNATTSSTVNCRIGHYLCNTTTEINSTSTATVTVTVTVSGVAHAAFYDAYGPKGLMGVCWTYDQMIANATSGIPDYACHGVKN